MAVEVITSLSGEDETFVPFPDGDTFTPDAFGRLYVQSARVGDVTGEARNILAIFSPGYWVYARIVE
jgi:hypothetical protein